MRWQGRRANRSSLKVNLHSFRDLMNGTQDDEWSTQPDSRCWVREYRAEAAFGVPQILLIMLETCLDAVVDDEQIPLPTTHRIQVTIPNVHHLFLWSFETTGFILIASLCLDCTVVPVSFLHLRKVSFLNNTHLTSNKCLPFHLRLSASLLFFRVATSYIIDDTANEGHIAPVTKCLSPITATRVNSAQVTL